MASRSVSLPIPPQAVALLSLESYGPRRKLTAISRSADTESTGQDSKTDGVGAEKTTALVLQAVTNISSVISRSPGRAVCAHRASPLTSEGHRFHFQACSGKEVPRFLLPACGDHSRPAGSSSVVAKAKSSHLIISGAIEWIVGTFLV